MTAPATLALDGVRRALVVGLGVSGAAAARALRAAGIAVRALEPDPVAAGRGRDVELVPADVPAARLLDGVELVVTSPGVRPDAPVVGAAFRAGVELIGEPELAWRLAGGGLRLVGVTGTNGKTTVTELLAACLDAPAVGNIGRPLCDLVAAPPPLAVAELSSFQLHTTHRLAPQVAVVTNLTPDHLDWHGSFVAYAAAKARIWAAQGPHDLALVGADPEAAGLLDAHPPGGRAQVLWAPDRPVAPDHRGRVVGPRALVADGRVVYDDGAGGRSPVIDVTHLARRAPHDLENVCTAVTAAVAAGADPAALGDPLRRHRPGAHRLAHVAWVDGVTYLDDSKATNPAAAAAALRTHPVSGAPDGARIVWIAGGLGKGLSFDPLAPLLPGRVRTTVTIGEAGPALAALARAAGVEAVEAGRLRTAVEVAAAHARPGDTVLLAPACASMDQFTDYAERGRRFAEAVATLGAAPLPVSPDTWPDTSPDASPVGRVRR